MARERKSVTGRFDFSKEPKHVKTILEMVNGLHDDITSATHAGKDYPGGHAISLGLRKEQIATELKTLKYISGIIGYARKEHPELLAKK